MRRNGLRRAVRESRRAKTAQAREAGVRRACEQEAELCRKRCVAV